MHANSQADLTNRIWNLCNVLRDDGVVFHKYLSELSNLLFLKNAKQLNIEHALPIGYRWDDLLRSRGHGMLSYYRKLLAGLGANASDGRVKEIFETANTVFSHDENLEKVASGIEAIDWHAVGRDALGEIYESLLERNANEARSGAGQYFTPRALVNVLANVMQPTGADVVLDPSCGTGGFLIAANSASGSPQKTPQAFQGVEIERDTYRLALMNTYLHGISARLIHGDALTSDSETLSPATLVLANPPFGVSPGGARPRRGDVPFPRANKQLVFLQAIFEALAVGGRAAVVVPDNVLNDDGAGKEVRKILVESFDLHTVLRLPSGIFYAAGVLTNVLFFNKPTSAGTTTTQTWFYDLRKDDRAYSRSRPLSDADLAPFAEAYGPDSKGKSPRQPDAYFRPVAVEQIRTRGYDLDIREESSSDLQSDQGTEQYTLSIAQSMQEAQQALQTFLRLLQEGPPYSAPRNN